MMSSPSVEPGRPSLAETVASLRSGRISSIDLVEGAIRRHEALGDRLGAYKHFDADGARRGAEEADRLLASGKGGPLCGIPVSVKDIFGVDGMPTFAGTARRLPDDPWSRDASLVRRIRDAGAVIMGKTHTVELAYGGVGMNPHWGTPLNPWDVNVARIPGGSSCGAGVSLWEGSALVALGSDTGGSIRIPAAFTGLVGHKTTKGRLPTDGVTQLSSTFDSVGALTNSVADSVWFFGCVDPDWGDPELLVEILSDRTLTDARILVPECGLWEDCQEELEAVLTAALEELADDGAELRRSSAPLIDDAYRHYMQGGIGSAEISDWLSRQLPAWREILHPTVGARIEGALAVGSEAYGNALEEHRRLMALAETLFDEADVLALPANLVPPPAVSDVVDDLERYKEVNRWTLRPTCPVNMMGLCAVSLPVGLDPSGMPVGLQLVAGAGDDEALLGVALAAERVLGSPRERLGVPPGAQVPGG